MKRTKIVSLGTMYIDINCINFPFEKGLFVHRETTGDGYQVDLGGSALNFAKLALLLNMSPTFIGKVGDDITGKLLMEMLKKNKITPAVMVDPKAQTNIAVHYVHMDGSSIMSSCGTANQLLSYTDITTLFNLQNDTPDYLYLGGCFKLKKLLPFLSKIAELAKNKNTKVVLDHGRVNNQVTQAHIESVYTLLPYVDMYLPSIDEFLAVWDVKTIDEGIAKCKKLTSALIVIKQGDLGAIGYDGDKRVTIPAFPITVKHTIGAGDSFNAGFIRAHSQKLDFNEAIKFACAIAAAKISSNDFTIENIEKLYRGKNI